MQLVRLSLLALLLWNADRSAARLLRVAAVDAEPFYKSDNQQEGYLVDLMEDLIARANVGTNEEVQYRFYRPSDGKYGSSDQHGRWNGLMGEVINGEADMAVAPLTITKARSEAVWFSHPFMTVMIVPLVKKPRAPGVPLPFSGLADLQSKLQSGNLTLGYIQHGSTEIYFSQHKMSKVRAMYDISKAAHTANPYVDSYASGVQQVRDDGRFVFYGEHTFFQYVMRNRPCDVAIAWSGAIGERHYGFIFPKTASGRQWMEKFNELLLAAQEDGTTAMLYSRWWYQRAACPAPNLCLCREESNLQSHDH